MLPVGRPSIRISPPAAFSSKPAICSKVDLPDPDGPTNATISPVRISRSVLTMTSSWPLACLKLCRMPRSSRTALLIAQSLHRIEPRSPPGWINRGQQRDHEGHAGNPGDIPGIGDRRNMRQEIDGLIEEIGAGEALQELANALDVIGNRNTQDAAEQGADHTDTGAGEQEDAQDGALAG